jgi:hypothetical protein
LFLDESGRFGQQPESFFRLAFLAAGFGQQREMVRASQNITVNCRRSPGGD